MKSVKQLQFHFTSKVCYSSVASACSHSSWSVPAENE